MVRLCLLNYKPIGTKLSFTNNKIVFQEPDFLQPAKRWSSGDSRLHIHNLYNPIFKLSQWYDISSPQFIYLLNKSKTGLLQLLKCYNENDSNIISHSINYYIETINNILSNTTENISYNTNDINQVQNQIQGKKKKNNKKNNTDFSNNSDTLVNNNDSSSEVNNENNINNEIITNTSSLEQSADVYSIKLKDLWN